MRINGRKFFSFSLLLILNILLLIFNGDKVWIYFIFFQIVYVLLSIITVYFSKDKTEFFIKQDLDNKEFVSIEMMGGEFFSILFKSFTLSIVNHYMEIEKKESYEISLKRKGAEKKIHIADKQCGWITVTVDFVKVSDPVGLFYKEKFYNEKFSIFIFPETVEISLKDDELEYYSLESYTYSQQRPGTDTNETFGIDEYKDGDSTKSIHWKLSEKMDKLLVRTPSLPVDNDIGFILNKSKVAGLDSSEYRQKLLSHYFSIGKQMLEKSVKFTGYIALDDEPYKLKITCEDDLLELIEEAMKTGFRRDNKAIDNLVNSQSFEKHGLYICVSYSPKDEEILQTYGKAQLWNPIGEKTEYR